MFNINLKYLETFVTVVDTNSFSRAAEQLFLAQSTVSNQIQALERELGISVFQRGSKKQILLTPDGQQIYQHAREILSRCQILEEEIKGYSEKELLIGTSSLPARSIVPQLVAGFLKTNPPCICVVNNGDSSQIQQMLLDNSIQIGFIGSADYGDALMYHKIADDHLVLITPNTLKFAHYHKAGVLGKDLLDEPILLREKGSGTQKEVDNYLSRIGLSHDNLKIAAQISSPDILCDMVALGVGISIISSSCIRSLLKSRKILSFELEESPFYRPIYIAHRRKTVLSAHAKKFLNFTLEQKNCFHNH